MQKPELLIVNAIIREGFLLGNKLDTASEGISILNIVVAHTLKLENIELEQHRIEFKRRRVLLIKKETSKVLGKYQLEEFYLELLCAVDLFHNKMKE